MTNEVIILFYLPLLLMNLILLSSVITKKQKLYVDRLYIILSLLLVVWLSFELLFYLTSNPKQIQFFYSAKFAFLAFIPPVFFFLIAGSYRLQKKFPGWVKALLLILPASTAVFALTSMHHEWFRTGVRIISTGPLTQIVGGRGLWYNANLGFTVIPVIGIVIIVIAQHRKLPPAYRPTATLLLMGFIVFLAGFVTEVARLDKGHRLDFNLIATSLTNLLFFIAISSNDRADYLNIWRRDIFDYLDEVVLILDAGGIVADANLPASRFFASLKVDPAGLPIDTLWKNLADTGKVSFRRLEGEDKTLVSEDLYVSNGKYPVIYNIQYREFSDGRTETGTFVILTESTRNRLLIERLRGLAGIDPLTQLKNRFGYKLALRELDRRENLPISIIIGDVNGLKSLNDTFGHQAGDALLAKAAEILLQCCPKNGDIARIGGDEFVIMLKHHDEKETGEVIRRIQAAAEAATDFPYPISIALGSATKNREDDNISALIAEADAYMYLNKKTGGQEE